MQDAPIKILIIEDNEYTRLGTVSVLGMQKGLQVVGEAGDGVEGLSLFDTLTPDVVVVDIRMPNYDGIQVTSNLCARNANAKVLIFSDSDGEEDIYRALSAGARGYLTKDARGPVLVEAVRTVAAGRRYFPPHIAERLAQRMNAPALTGRERDVLEKMADGLTNRQIGEALALTERTCGVYVGHVLAKLGAKTRTEAVAIALQRGLLRRSEDRS